MCLRECKSTECVFERMRVYRMGVWEIVNSQNVCLREWKYTEWEAEILSLQNVFEKELFYRGWAWENETKEWIWDNNFVEHIFERICVGENMNYESISTVYTCGDVHVYMYIVKYNIHVKPMLGMCTQSQAHERRGESVMAAMFCLELAQRLMVSNM